MAKKDKKDKKINNNSMVAELKKVTWPTGSELFKATVAVFTIIFIVVLILFISDSIFTLGTKKFTNFIKTRQEKVKEEKTNEKKETKVEVKNDKKEEKTAEKPKEELNTEKNK